MTYLKSLSFVGPKMCHAMAAALTQIHILISPLHLSTLKLFVTDAVCH